MLSPKDIYQAQLDELGQAYWDMDFSKVLDMIHFPSFVETDDLTLHLPDRESYLASLISQRDNLTMRGATAYHRICRDAVVAHDDPHRIEGIHEVYALQGATLVMDPYLTQMSLVYKNGAWLCTGLRSATTNKNLKIVKHPEPTTGSPAPEAALKET